MTQRDPALRPDIAAVKDYLCNTPLRAGEVANPPPTTATTTTSTSAGSAAADSSPDRVADAPMDLDGPETDLSAVVAEPQQEQQEQEQQQHVSAESSMLAPDYFTVLYELMLDIHFNGGTQDERIRYSAIQL
jgi:hypothetical protein